MALLVAACAGDKRQAQDASGSSTTAVAALQGTMRTPTPRQDFEATVQLSQQFRSRCSLPDAPREAPRFDYDQATLRPRGENVLDDVARCLTEGGLKGELITIVGRADPRGSDEYNEDLGRSRAAAARNYLVQKGVPADRIRLMSRGSEGARGTDEASWALDRRVDFELGDLTAAASQAGAPSTASGESPIMEGTRLQAETSEARSKEVDAASYADTAEGGKPTGSAASPSTSAASSSGSGSSSASSSGKASGSTSSGSVKGSASGSANVGGNR
ncbi:MAG TPA: OmpA family protein [Polyangiaceae bacterium]|nr:OmpA family protein [Polyangiaceae bacterium]